MKYATSNYIVLISEREGSPLSLLDAIAHDVTLIGNRVSGTKDLIEAFGGVLLPENQLMEDLKRLLLAIKNNKPMPFEVFGQLKEQSYFSG